MEICVFHLIRVGTGPHALSRFLESYQLFDAGHRHRLVFLLKGFERALPPEIAALLASVPHTTMHCPNHGFDLGSYFFACARVSEPLVMFTNSFSIFQGDDWLLKLLNAHGRQNVGAVGATGSWESLSSFFLDQRRDRTRPDYLLATAKALAIGVPLLALFPAFPNAHLRTNGFLIARERLLSIRPRIMRTKLDAWLFESGRLSMTRKLFKQGLEVLVVGRDGSIFSPENWNRSQTFWQASQENLLIHDNRTMAFGRGDPLFQKARSMVAWGESSHSGG